MEGILWRSTPQNDRYLIPTFVWLLLGARRSILILWYCSSPVNVVFCMWGWWNCCPETNVLLWAEPRDWISTQRKPKCILFYANLYCKCNTFMHLADAFIQSDLQCIQAIHFLSVCVFPGNRTHNLCAANAMLYHQATGTLYTIIIIKNHLFSTGVGQSKMDWAGPVEFISVFVF